MIRGVVLEKCADQTLQVLIETSLENGLDLSIPVDPDYPGQTQHQPKAFGLPNAEAEAVRFGEYVLDVRQGGAVNCDSVSLCCHSNGTHTEGIGHIVKDRVSVLSCEVPILIPTLLISVVPEKWGEDHVISKAQVEAKIPKPFKCKALIVRCFGEYDRLGRKDNNYTGTNPPYFSEEAIKYITDDLGVMHLLVDLPSIDREECGPGMPNHSIFFGLPPNSKELSTSKLSRRNATITELCDIYAQCKDGTYLLTLQLGPIKMDATPSRPIIFPCEMETTTPTRDPIPPARVAVVIASLTLSIIILKFMSR